MPCCLQLLQDAQQLAERLASGAYPLGYELVDAGDMEPRTVNISTRLYSAAATTRCLEFKLSWHSRSRAYSVELFNRVYFRVRWASGCSPLGLAACAWPTAAVLGLGAAQPPWLC
jgi:hypothetical protein